MGMLDDLFGKLGEDFDVANLADKLGLDKDQVAQAIGALAKAHPEPGDTAEGAAAATGLPLAKIQDIIGHIGGEGSLARFADMLKDQQGLLGQLGGMAEGLFGKK